jgi:hypothetical protein
MAGEVVHEEVEGGRSEDDIRFEIDIKKCLNCRSDQSIVLYISRLGHAFNKISSKTWLPDGTTKLLTCRSARVERG